jgi:hypothetical protein
MMLEFKEKRENNEKKKKGKIMISVSPEFSVYSYS